MAQRKGKRVRRVPRRTCVGCRQVDAKRALIRVVRTPDGVLVDPSGKQAGRGAYLHAARSCWEKGLKGSLARALKTTLQEADLARLQAFLATLADE